MARRLFARFIKTKEDSVDGAEGDKLNHTVDADRADSLSQKIASGIEQISQNVSELETLIRQTGASRDSEDHRNRMLQIVSVTHQIAKDSSTDIKELFQQPLPTEANEQQYSKEHRETLRTQFCTALEGFKAVEKSVAEKERASLNKTAASQTSDDEWVLVSSQDIQQANGSPKLSQKHAEEKANARIELAMIQERHKDILKLESSISELHEMFMDMAMLIEQQGEIIDRIEYDTEAAIAYIEESKTAVPRSRKYQNKARRKLCCIIGTSLSIVAIIGIVLTIVVNRLFLIMPVTSFLGFIVSGVCFYRSFKIQFKLKSTSDGTDIKLKAKGTQEGVSVDLKAKIKA